MFVAKTTVMNKIRITVFADPVCTWCWGSVPVLRALKYRYGEQLEISYVMGVMIENIETFQSRGLSIGGDIAVSNRNIHENWIDSSSVHGMPVCEKKYPIFSKERKSTRPQNRAYITARFYLQKCEGSLPSDAHLRYLRRLQEATAVDAVLTNDVDILADLSATVGFEPAKFRELYDCDAVTEMLKEDIGHCRSYEVSRFPSFILSYKNEEMMLRGYSTYDLLHKCIEQLSYDNIKPLNDGSELFTPENVRRFIATCGTAYPVEVATAFGLPRHSGHSALNAESYTGLPDVMTELVESGQVAMAPKGNGFIYYTLKENACFDIHSREMAVEQG